MQAPDMPHTNLVDGTEATTASVNLPFNNVGYNSFIAYLNVTAHAGTSPTLDVKFQDSPDNGTTWYDIDDAALTQVTTTNGQQRLVVNNAGPKCRAVVAVGGTSPSYTFALDVMGVDSSL